MAESNMARRAREAEGAPGDLPPRRSLNRDWQRQILRLIVTRAEALFIAERLPGGWAWFGWATCPEEIEDDAAVKLIAAQEARDVAMRLLARPAPRGIERDISWYWLGRHAGILDPEGDIGSVITRKQRSHGGRKRPRKPPPYQKPLDRIAEQHRARLAKLGTLSTDTLTDALFTDPRVAQLGMPVRHTRRYATPHPGAPSRGALHRHVLRFLAKPS